MLARAEHNARAFRRPNVPHRIRIHTTDHIPMAFLSRSLLILVLSVAPVGGSWAVSEKPSHTNTTDRMNVASVASDDSQQASLSNQTASPPASLWDRLERGYRLGNLEESPERVERFEREFAQDPMYFRVLAKRAKWFLYYILEEVEKRNMPTEIALVPAIESMYQMDSTSPANAAGIWQFMETTGKRFGLRQDWWLDARRDLFLSTRAALDYLQFLSREFNGDWELALAAYNAGEGAVIRQIRQNRSQNLPTAYAYLQLHSEARSYVPKLMALRNILRDPEQYGVQLPPLENRPYLQFVDLQSQTDITVAASLASMTLGELQHFNLGYKRQVTPPNGPHLLAVPTDRVNPLLSRLASLRPIQRIQWAHHKVKPGEYLGHIAQLYGTSVDLIQDANELDSDLIYPDQELKIPFNIDMINQYAGPTWEYRASERSSHTVQSGDSLWSISRKYGVRLSDLIQWNRLPKAPLIHPGQTLFLNP